MKSGLTACAAALGLLALPAHAEVRRLPDEVVGYETPHRNTGGIIVGDAIGGAVVGGLAGGGVAAYRNYVNNDGWGNWQRDVLVGAGIGLGVGLILGVADVASSPDRTFMGPVSDQRETGFGSPMAARAFRF
ncbi:MAG TPA: hypothetical protein VLW85_20265 [Myxococcales bacterium]|nr:hypothetical protein [Myxococcales bacterium]